MGRPKKDEYDDYNERLLAYITDYVRKEGVPPTIDMMIANVKGRSSKSTVFLKLQKMVDEGLLVQKNVKGYYYPTSIDVKEVSVPKFMLEQACLYLSKTSETSQLAKNLYKYLEKDE